MSIEYNGLLYRALNPIYAAEPLSGRGAELFGGRFNIKGTAALYLSFSPETAIRESNQVGTLQPTTLVAYEADLSGLFDARDEEQLVNHGTTATEIARSDWRLLAPKAPGQLLAQRLIAKGLNGLVTRSFANGASYNDQNVVLWEWGEKSPHRLRVIDDQNRLGTTPKV